MHRSKIIKNLKQFKTNQMDFNVRWQQGMVFFCFCCCCFFLGGGVCGLWTHILARKKILNVVMMDVFTSHDVK